MEDCQADELFASSISGDVNVIACKADKMDVVSISGDIKAEFDKSAQCRAKSTSGDCKVTIGNQVDAVVSSTSGDVNVRYIGEIGLEWCFPVRVVMFLLSVEELTVRERKSAGALW